MADETAKDYFEKGLQHFNAGEWDDAMDSLKNSISLKPEYVDSYNLLGKVYEKRGKLDAAKRCWLLALRFDPGNATAKQLISALDSKVDEGKKHGRFGSILWPIIVVVLLAALITTNLTMISYINRLKTQNILLASDLKNAKILQESLQKRLASITAIKENPDFSVALLDQKTETKTPPGQTQPKIEDLQDYPTKPIVPQPDQTEEPFTTTAQLSDAYDEALSAFNNRQYSVAMKTFQKIVNSPQSHELKDNAQYWLAECYYVQKKFSAALSEFEKVKKNFPGANKVFDSEIKVSLSYLNMGNKEKARSKLAQISREWTDPKYKPKIDEISKLIQTSGQ